MWGGWVAAAIAFMVGSVVADSAFARVFNYKDNRFAAYMRGTGGLSNVGQEPFIHSSGADTAIDGETNFQYSGELGFVFTLGGPVSMRVGAELIQHRPVKEAKGLSPSGTERFTMDSDVVVFNPNVTFEYVYRQMNTIRFFMLAGAGMADVTVENTYAMTAAGTAELGGVTDHTEKLSGSAVSGHLGVGIEALFTDNITFLVDAGYRYLPIRTLKHKGDANTIVSPGGVGKGDVAMNHDGSKRAMDLSGLTIGLTFRFYLHFM